MGGIAFGRYSAGNTNTALVYAIGAPTVPDNGTLPDAPYIQEKGIDVIVPDYIGYGRSDGVFTPKNCIKTLLSLYEKISSGCVVANRYDRLSVKLKYKKVIFVGRSLGGAYVPLLPRFNSNIKALAIFYGAVDQAAQGEIEGEETNPDLLESMKQDGYHHLYRGVTKPAWKKHLENKDGLSPMDNIKYLRNAKLFIAHGKKDTCIHYSKSVKYYQKIKSIFPEARNQFKLSLYPKGDHGPSTTNPAIRDFLDWIEV